MQKNIHNKKMEMQRGFTLIEILVVMGIIALLTTIVLVAVNPARQFAQARDTQRSSNVNTILNAIGERLSDNRGLFETGCAAGVIPTSTTMIKSGSGGYDIYPCLVPTYVPSLPLDPSGGSFTATSSYATGYTVAKDPTTGRITVAAPSTEIGTTTISVSR